MGLDRLLELLPADDAAVDQRLAEAPADKEGIFLGGVHLKKVLFRSNTNKIINHY
jgi:hypothetical protein